MKFKDGCSGKSALLSLLALFLIIGLQLYNIKGRKTLDSLSKIDDINVGSLGSIRNFDLLTGKKQYRRNDKPRIIFFAGLPFSNQNLVNDVLREICGRKCVSLLDVAPLEDQLFSPKLIRNFTEAKLRDKMKLKTLVDTLGKDSLYFINVFNHHSKKNIEISTTYPDISTDQNRDISLLHPNIHFLESYFMSLGFEPIFVALIDNLESTASTFLDEIINKMKKFSKSQSITALRTLDMNIRNLYAQFSLLDPSHRLFLDFSSFTDFDSFDDFVQELDKFEDITELYGFSENIKSRMHYAERVEATLNRGEQQFLKKMKVIQNHYRSKFYNKPKILTSTTSYEQIGKPRMVFFAGLEGTGHHLWRDINGALNDNKKNLISRPISECKVVSLFYTSKSSCFQAFADRSPFFCSSNSVTYHKAYNNAILTLNNLDETFKNNSVILLNLAHFNYFAKKDKECHVIASYPAFSGRDKSLNKVDLLEFSLIFNEVPNLEFKPIILLRRTADFVYSDVWRRKFHRQKPLLFEEKVLENNAASLMVELEVLGLTDLPCVEFNSIVVNPSETDPIADTLRINREDLRTIVTDIYKKNSTSPEKELPSKHEEFITTLRMYNDAVYKRCGKV